MKKDYCRMPRVLSIIAGIVLLLNCLNMTITVIDQTSSMFNRFLNYSVSFDNPFFTYTFYETISTVFTLLFMILTAVMLLRGKRDLFAGLAFAGTAIFWIVYAVFNIFVMHPVGMEVGYSTRESLIFTVCSALFLTALWLIPAFFCLTKNKFRQLFFLPILVVFVYTVYCAIFNLSLSIDALIMQYSTPSHTFSFFEVIRMDPFALVELSLETAIFCSSTIPYALFAVTCSMPGRVKPPKSVSAKTDTQKPLPAYVPSAPAKATAVKPKTAPSKPLSAYVPPAPAKATAVKPKTASSKPLPAYVSSAPAKADPLEQQLRSLKNLREQDLISQEEYNAKKKQLLGL